MLDAGKVLPPQTDLQNKHHKIKHYTLQLKISILLSCSHTFLNVSFEILVVDQHSIS